MKFDLHIDEDAIQNYYYMNQSIPSTRGGIFFGKYGIIIVQLGILFSIERNIN